MLHFLFPLLIASNSIDSIDLNAELVKEAMRVQLIDRNSLELEKYYWPEVNSHVASFEDGIDAIKSSISFDNPSLDEMSYDQGIVFSDGDFVINMGRIQHVTPQPILGFDVFRIEYGKIAEYWNVMEYETSELASVFVNDFGFISLLGNEEELKESYKDMFKHIFVDKDFDEFSSYFKDSLVDHDAQMKDKKGLDNFIQKATDSSFNYQLGFVFSRGNYVFSTRRCTTTLQTRIFADLVRYEDGLIAEHWILREDEVATPGNNIMFSNSTRKRAILPQLKN